MPAEPLFNPHWHRVSGLLPRLAPQVRVKRQAYRDQTWYVLADAAKGTHYRINAAAYQFVGRCDGTHTTNALWEFLLERLGDDAPTQGDIVNLLGQLGRQELLHYAVRPDIESLFGAQGAQRQRRRRARINPLAFQVPLLDPTALLERMRPVLPWLFRPATLMLWAALVLVGAAAAAVNWSALALQAGTQLTTPRYLLLAWLCYPLIKALHELAHAAAVRHWGGEVHEAGITLLFFTPAPYVDASAATEFRSRWQRAVVSAAGIMVELLLASLALGVWLMVQPGLIRDAAFVVLFIGSVSTLLFNGNPLLRFDGYYVVSDLLDIPNLSSRSTSFWIQLLRRHLLRAPEPGAMPPAAGELKWLALYAPLSFVYRVVLAAGLLLWAGGHSWMLGLLLALLLFGGLLAKPVRQFFAALLPAGLRSGRERAVVAGSVFFLLLLLVALPVPFTATAQGVVWPPEDAQLRASIDGFITQVRARSGAQVEAEQTLVELYDPVWPAERAALQSRIGGLHAEQYGALLRDPSRAQQVDSQIARTEAELARVDQRIAGLQLSSKVAGRLVLPRPEDLPENFVKKGELLGYVIAPGAANVRAVVSGDDAQLVRSKARGAEVRLAEHPGSVIVASITRDMPAATFGLPTAALGERAGGNYRTDPQDETGMRAVEPFFQFDLALPEQRLERIGGRAWVRFDLGYSPLAVQWYLRLRQLQLRYVNPEA